MRLRSAIAAHAAAFAASAIAGTPITVQVVNDSGHSDYEVFLLLTGKGIKDAAGVHHAFSVSGVTSIDPDTTSNPATGTPLSCLNAPSPCSTPIQQATSGGQPLTVRSPYTGAKNLPVYEFTMTTVGSGVLYVSYDTPVTYPVAPTVTAPYRFQPLEFSYADFTVSNGDLTSIDFYGIPLELTTYAPGDTAFKVPQDLVTYYSSTEGILNAMLAVSSNMQSAMVAKSCSSSPCTTAAFVPGTTPYKDFLRVIGPNQVAAPGASPLPPPATGSVPPWPYPSFAGYLTSLQNYTFKEKDDKLVSSFVFDYTGTVLPMTPQTTATCLDPSLAGNGWLIKLTGTTNASTLPSNADICIPLVTDRTKNNNVDYLIYGASQSCEAIGIYDPVSGKRYPCTDGATSNETLANSVYGWIQADVLAAINFGYLQGKLDDANGVGHSGTWYGLPPVPYPFARARKTNDGYYNAWAALMYNLSDAYGFAFSDRNGRPSPDISFPVGGTVRVWILPDKRLDAPQVTATPGPSSITVAWPPVNGADHYAVTWSPPYQPQRMTVPQPQSGNVSAVLPVSTGGTPYLVTVRALDADETKGSAEVSVYTRTTGQQPQSPAGNASTHFGLNWTPPPSIFGSSAPDLYIAGTKYTYDPGTGAGTYSTTSTTPIVTGPPTTTSGLTATGTGLAVIETIDPPGVAPNGVATLAVTLGDPALSSFTPQSAFVIAAPQGVTFSAIPVSLAAQFNPPSIPTQGSSTLTVALGNNGPASATLAAPLTVTLPNGATVNAPNSGSCSNVSATVGASTITMASNSVIPPNGCNIVVGVTSSAQGSFAATTSALQTNVGAASAASAALTVMGGLQSVYGSVTPSTIFPGGTASLVVTLNDAAQGTTTLQGGFTIALPAGVSVVTSATGISQALTQSGSPVTKVAANSAAKLTISLANTSNAAITLNAPFTDTFPPGVTSSSTTNAGTCPGVTFTQANFSMAAGGAIPPGGCTIVATITPASPGSLANTTSGLRTSGGNAPPSSLGLSVTGTGMQVQMALSPTSVNPGSATNLVITLGDGTATPFSMSNGFQITMPAGLTSTQSPTTDTTCIGGVVNSGNIVVGAVAQPQGTCTIGAVVTTSTTASGTYVLTSTALDTSNGDGPAATVPLQIAGGATTCGSVTAVPGGLKLANGSTFNNSCTIAATLTATSASTQPILTSIMATSAGTGATGATIPFTVASAPCPGVSITATNIATGVSTVPSGTCSITAGVSASQPGTTVVTTGTLSTSSRSAGPSSAPLTVTGVTGNVTQQISPPSVAVGGTATLTLTLLNAGNQPITLSEDFVDALPSSLTIQGGISGTCGASGSGQVITLPAGNQIPSGGCTIVAALQPSSAGSFTNTTGVLLTNATVYPVQSFPMEMRWNNDVIWFGNYYLTFIGSPQSFAIGPCVPGDSCIGSGLPNPVPYDTPHSPNFLERQQSSTGLSIQGGASLSGPPFSLASPPTIGVSFTPIADKKPVDVVFPPQ